MEEKKGSPKAFNQEEVSLKQSLSREQESLINAATNQDDPTKDGKIPADPEIEIDIANLVNDVGNTSS